MILEGVVTNVANFGAFVDIGVHQDGLVHISALSDTFIKDPRDVVRVGQTVTVKVQEVDVPRKRIGLTMRLNDDAAPVRRGAPEARPAGGAAARQQGQKRPAEPAASGAMAAAFAKLRK